LPRKIEEVIHCEQSDEQQTLYQQLLSTSRKELVDNANGQQQSRLNNIMMQLRKMACHPLLHRTRYTDDLLKKMSREILKEEQYWDSDAQYVFEDMQLLTDFELHKLCLKNKSIRRHALPDSLLLDSGKTKMLCQQILPQCKERGDRVLLFSQFTMMLDVLEMVLQHQGYRYLRLDGQTPVAERQPLIDQFYEDKEIFVFLLSTKAGGFGINLTPANYVIQHDLDFNPFNDCQAEDRAYRIGQTRDVHVLKLITRGTIEEQIYQRALRKLKLDTSLSASSVAEEEETGGKRTKKVHGSGGEEAPQIDPGTLMEMLRADFNEHSKN
jgi:SWI/SNF-related matrix-associated actin-dependent regulator 1 of chromatin subfamily A